MSKKAVQLKVNGSKTYKVVDAHRDITKNMVEEYNLLNSNTFFIHPKEGYLALFPSNVLHGTESLVSNLSDDRLAIIGDITLILKEHYLRYTNGYVDQKYWKQF